MGTGLTSPKSITSLKVIFYARGGGFGHFNRAYAISRCLIRYQIRPLIISSSAFLPLAITESIHIIRWPGGLEPGWPELHRGLINTLHHLNPHLLVVDTFPNGPENELRPFGGPRVFIQRDTERCWNGPSIRAFPTGDGYILNRSPEELLPRSQARQYLRALKEQPLVLIAHNGNPAETTAFFWRLLKVLEPIDCQIRLASLLPCPRPEWQQYWVQHFPLSEWLNGVDLLIGGGGYNLVAEARSYGVPVLLTAFDRPIDRQAQRIQSLPHFHSHHTTSYLREHIQTILSQPRPIPEQSCQGAKKASDLIVNLLHQPAL